MPSRHNLPAQTTPFVGREAILSTIAQHLQDPDCRLLSLVGPGGIGKTRLALEAAREQVGCYEDGVYWVPLAPLHSIDTMVSTLAQAIGFAPYSAGDPWQRLLHHLREKQMLLVLDNVEHLLAEQATEADHFSDRDAVDLVNAMLRAAPGVKLVTTSRARLNVQSETLLPISGMDYPALTALTSGGTSALDGSEIRDLAGYSAVQLFLATARRVRPEFGPDAAELADVVRICRLVQGMPLAILLAATWIEMLSPAEIVAELERGYDLLEADLRDLPARQRSIGAVCDVSWQMLTEAERAACARLSVFRGGFTRDAAAKVASVGLRTLISLVRKSFLQRDAAGRYESHELLRLYAESKLAETPEEKERVSDLHCRHYAELLPGGLANVDWRVNTRGFLIEADNIRLGWRWAVSQARFAEILKYRDLVVLFWRGSMPQESIASLEWAVRVTRTHCADGGSREGSTALAQLLVLLARRHQFWDPGGRVELREKLVEEAVSILRGLDAQRELADIAPTVAWVYGPERDAEARQILEQGHTFCREQGDLKQASILLSVLGEMDVRLGAYDRAERYSREAIAVGEKGDAQYGIGYALTNLAKIAYFRADYQAAIQLYEKTLARDETGGQRHNEAMRYSLLGDTALIIGDWERARECHRYAWAVYKDWGIYWSDATSGQHFGVAYSLDRLGDDALALGEVEQARDAYRQALEIARDHPYVMLNLDVVVSHAALLAYDGERERAAELAAQVLYHPKGYVEVKERARRMLDLLETELPRDLFVGAQERGRARDLEATVKELLDELSE